MAKFHLSIDNEKSLCNRTTNLIGIIGWAELTNVQKCKICSKKFMVVDASTIAEGSATMTPKNLALKDLDENMKARICRSMQNTFNAIAADLFQCRIDCGEKGDMPRIEVIEVVCDAGHMKTHGGDDEAYDVFNKLDYNDMKKLGKVAFPYAKYC